MVISVSLLATYLYCPRKVFLQKALSLREPLREPLILGTIRHAALEHANNTESEVVIDLDPHSSFEEALALYRAHYARHLREQITEHLSSLVTLGIEPLDVYEEALPSLLMHAKGRCHNAFSFMQRTTLSGEELWRALTPKIHSEVRLESQTLRLRGIIDQVSVGDIIFPIELKTGRAPKEGVWPGHRIQAAAYALLLEEAYGKSVPYAVVSYLDCPETESERRVVLNPFMRDEILSLVSEIEELLSNNLLPEHCESQSKCLSCGLKEKCHDSFAMSSLLAKRTIALSTPQAALKA